MRDHWMSMHHSMGVTDMMCTAVVFHCPFCISLSPAALHCLESRISRISVMGMAQKQPQVSLHPPLSNLKNLSPSVDITPFQSPSPAPSDNQIPRFAIHGFSFRHKFPSSHQPPSGFSSVGIQIYAIPSGSRLYKYPSSGRALKVNSIFWHLDT